jgi:opacity protein-like surface antigen
MKNLRFCIIAAVAMTFTSLEVNAASFNIQYAMLDTDFGGVDLEPTALQFGFSNPIGTNIAVDGVLAIGLGDDEISVSGGGDSFTLGFELANLIGIYARAFADIAPNSQVYGRVGLAKIEYDMSVNGFISGFGNISGTVSEDDTGLTYGIGAIFGVSPNGAIVVEYNQLPDVDFEGLDIESSTLSVGYQMNL